MDFFLRENILKIRHFFGVSLFILSAGCLPLKTETASAPYASQEYEAPEVFSQTASGFWNGASSSGGIWAVSTQAKQRQFAVIKNNINGQETRALLLPYIAVEETSQAPEGFLISSDAAEVLGIAANEVVSLTVIALASPVQDAVATDLPPFGLLVASIPPDVADTSAVQTAEATTQKIILGPFAAEAEAKANQDALTSAGFASKTGHNESKEKWYVVLIGGTQDLARLKSLGYENARFLKE